MEQRHRQVPLVDKTAAKSFAVLERLATGATNPTIAMALHLSERTVAHHVSAILAKLGAPTRLAAVEQARRRGLLSQDGSLGEPR